jgi:hypothetical protein
MPMAWTSAWTRHVDTPSTPAPVTTEVSARCATGARVATPGRSSPGGAWGIASAMVPAPGCPRAVMPVATPLGAPPAAVGVAPLASADISAWTASTSQQARSWPSTWRRWEALEQLARLKAVEHTWEEEAIVVQTTELDA